MGVRKQLRWLEEDRGYSTSCHIWQLAMNSSGYGVVRIPRTRVMTTAHRQRYAEVHGPIPPGLEVDHLCRQTDCVNPEHMEVVTPRVNHLRSNSVSGINARKTHCPKGHPYDEENTRRRPSGQRECKACARQRNCVQMADSHLVYIGSAIWRAGELARYDVYPRDGRHQLGWVVHERAGWTAVSCDPTVDNGPQCRARWEAATALWERPLPSVEHPTDVPAGEGFEHAKDDGAGTPLEATA